MFSAEQALAFQPRSTAGRPRQGHDRPRPVRSRRGRASEMTASHSRPKGAADDRRGHRATAGQSTGRAATPSRPSPACMVLGAGMIVVRDGNVPGWERGRLPRRQRPARLAVPRCCGRSSSSACWYRAGRGPRGRPHPPLPAGRGRPAGHRRQAASLERVGEGDGHPRAARHLDRHRRRAAGRRAASAARASCRAMP